MSFISRFIRRFLDAAAKVPARQPPPPIMPPLYKLPAGPYGKLPHQGQLDEREAARTLWGEARSESEAGQIAVAWVMRTRAERPGWWGGPGLASVCLKPYQFSCRNPDDPQSARIERLEPAEYARQLAIVRKVILGQVADPTAGCDHFCTLDSHPYWARGRRPDTIIGHHKFYRIGLDGKGA